MATENSPLASTPVEEFRTPAAKRPTSVFRVALPLVYAGMGVALGTLTGVGLAFVSVPASASVSSSDSIPVMPVSSGPVSAAQTIHGSHPAAVLRIAEEKGSSNGNESRGGSRSASSAPEAKNGAKQNPLPEGQVEPGKEPEVEKDTNLAPIPNSVLQRKHVAHPVKVQSRTVMASVPEVIDVPTDNDQLASADEPKPPTFYSEGDLTVADYNASAGTIQTSDGRTFELGTTVRVSSSTTWDDYRSSVHYRCDQEGSCMLIRAGAVAANAKVI